MHLWVLRILLPEDLKVLLVQDGVVERDGCLHLISLVLLRLLLSTPSFVALALRLANRLLWTHKKVLKQVWRSRFGDLESLAFNVQG